MVFELLCFLQYQEVVCFLWQRKKSPTKASAGIFDLLTVEAGQQHPITHFEYIEVIVSYTY